MISDEDLGVAREHRCAKAVQKLETAIQHVRRLGYHGIADDVSRARDTLRTLTRAESTRASLKARAPYPWCHKPELCVPAHRCTAEIVCSE